MDAANLAAAWLSFTVTAVGLGSLVTQAKAIQDQLDPYSTLRGIEHLGLWVACQPQSPWYRLSKPSPRGPIINAHIEQGLCGQNIIRISRLPIGIFGRASWTVCLAIYHPPNKTIVDTHVEAKHAPWSFLNTQPLERHGTGPTACVTIDRATLIALLALSNAREIFCYRSASGYRAAHGSYCGHWYITWPLDGSALLKFVPHDNNIGRGDVYPPTFQRRTDKCMEMVTGVISSSKFRCAFPGRQRAGYWVLEHLENGFHAAHGSRHLYNMMGGRAYEVDYLSCRRVQEPQDGMLHLLLPAREADGSKSNIYVPVAEQAILLHALDCLPWDTLSWSVHRGLRDILLAFAKPTMDRYRSKLAERVRLAVVENRVELQKQGWNSIFVDNTMSTIAANAINAGSGNAGDTVRLVTNIVAFFWSDIATADETHFWRDGLIDDTLTSDAIIALTKCFILEWSMEFDYQMYHDLPAQIRFS